MAAKELSTAHQPDLCSLIARVSVCTGQLEGIHRLLFDVCEEPMSGLFSESKSHFDSFLAVQAALRQTIQDLRKNVEEINQVQRRQCLIEDARQTPKTSLMQRVTEAIDAEDEERLFGAEAADKPRTLN